MVLPIECCSSPLKIGNTTAAAATNSVDNNIIKKHLQKYPHVFMAVKIWLFNCVAIEFILRIFLSAYIGSPAFIIANNTVSATKNDDCLWSSESIR